MGLWDAFVHSPHSKLCAMSINGNILTPCLSYIALISVFYATDGAARTFSMIPLFLPPHDKY